LRLRQKVQGTAERPRMSVFVSNQHLYVQFIDDAAAKTLAAVSTLQAGLKGQQAERGDGQAAGRWRRRPPRKRASRRSCSTAAGSPIAAA
jgi:ribosomal protein L18